MLVLIVNDESLTRSALENVLSSQHEIEGFDPAQGAMETLQKLKDSSSRILLLDINTPQLSEKERAQQAHRLPSSAPVKQLEAIAHALQENSANGKSIEIRKPRMAHRSQDPRIAIKVKGRILFINPADIIAVEAEGNYVLIHHGANSYSLRESISVVEAKLRSFGFIQIHRSVLVNTAFVEEIKPCLTGEYSLRMKDGKEYTVTRTYKKNLGALADSWIGNGTFVDE
jgi:DNA-binding LytR/AlgR family response regulator